MQEDEPQEKIRDPRETARQILLNRQRAYIQVFEKESQSFLEVIKDLEKFCRANESTFDPDPRIHAALEGRREVYLRIKDFVFLPSNDLLDKYMKK